MGVFLGAGKFTGLYRENTLVEKQLSRQGDTVCLYEFTL